MHVVACDERGRHSQCPLRHFTREVSRAAVNMDSGRERQSYGLKHCQTLLAVANRTRDRINVGVCGSEPQLLHGLAMRRNPG